MMFWIVASFLILFALPFVEVSRFIRFNLSTPVKIPFDRTKDPRFFAKSFRRKFNSAWRLGMKTAYLSKSDRVITPDELGDFTEPCDAIVFSVGDYYLNQASAVFNKEVLIKGKADLRGELEFRSIAVDDVLMLGYGVKIKRWVDAEASLYVSDHCDLGISASSNERLCIGRNVRFQRLYAPIIELGKSLQETPDYPVHPKLEEAMRLVPSELRQSSLDPRHVKEDFVHASIITINDLVIPDDLSINGYLRVYGDLTLGENVLISGNVFVDGDLDVGRGCVLLGNIFVRGDIMIHDHVVLGQMYHPISMVGIKKIQVGVHVSAYGYIHSGQGGIIYPETISKQMIDELRTRDERTPFKCSIKTDNDPAFLIDDELKHSHPLGLRTMEYVEEINIPEGVTVLRRSFFYKCENLKQVTLPSTLKHIEAYAFYGCNKLEHVNLDHCVQLERIDEFAFAHCTKLQEVTLPSSLKHLGPAVFMECKALKSLSFSQATLLSIIPEHFCMNCSELLEVKLPLLTALIETSAFRNCFKLKQLSLPTQVHRIDAYAFEGMDRIQLKITSPAQKAQLIANGLPMNSDVVEEY